MKGKKIDHEYVTKFVQNCAEYGVSNTAQIVAYANKLISIIDLKIIEIEDLKKERSKILDVISALGDTTKDKSADRKILSKYEKVHK